MGPCRTLAPDNIWSIGTGCEDLVQLVLDGTAKQCHTFLVRPVAQHVTMSSSTLILCTTGCVPDCRAKLVETRGNSNDKRVEAPNHYASELGVSSAICMVGLIAYGHDVLE